MSLKNLHNRVTKDQDKKRKDIHSTDIVLHSFEYEELLVKGGASLFYSPNKKEPKIIW